MPRIRKMARTPFSSARGESESGTGTFPSSPSPSPSPYPLSHITPLSWITEATARKTRWPKRGKRKKKKRRRSEEGLYAVVQNARKGNTFMAYLYKLEQHSLRLSRNPGFLLAQFCRWSSFSKGLKSFLGCQSVRPNARSS